MAEGFLNMTPTKRDTNSRSIEDIGEEYFNNLIVNSFFQDVEVDAWEKNIVFKMHDLLHDLALSISDTEMSVFGSGCIFRTRDGRRLNFACKEGARVEEVPEFVTDQARKLHTVFTKAVASPVFLNFKSLRSLDLSDAELEELPITIGKLKHLRYLDISKNEKIQVLPDSIIKLYNLQTLRLLECKSLKELPKNTRNLVCLRHVYFDDKSLMPYKVGCLTSLQTLPFFVVGLEEGHKISELEGLNELRGELVLYNLELVRNGEEAKRAKLEEKKKVSELVLKWMEVEEKEYNHEDVLENLKAPPSIQSLTIEWYMGKRFPQWMSQLNKLVNLELKHCKMCERMPTLGHLPRLKVLVVEEMDNIEYIGSEFYGGSNAMDILFPALEELIVEKMKRLVQWSAPEGTQLFSSLRRVSIRDCPCLTTIPLNQLTSSTIVTSLIGMHIEFESSKRLRGSWHFQVGNSLDNMIIDTCPKLALPSLIGLMSCWFLKISHFYDFLSKNAYRKEISSISFDKSFRDMEIFGIAEYILLPESLKFLVIERDFHNASVDAFLALSSIELLIIRGLREGSIPTLSSLTTLTNLQIKSCCIESIPSISSLTRLEKLNISWCSKLRGLPDGIKLCTSLKHLEICGCTSIDIPDEIISSFTQLKRLVWGKFSEELEELRGFNGIHPLSNPHLEMVNLYGWEKLRSLPYQLQHLTSIKKLEITLIPGLESLPEWFENLPALEILRFYDCHKLKNLPKSLKCLSKLRILHIGRCPLLKETCTKDGSDWPNISHIPYIFNNSNIVQNL